MLFKRQCCFAALAFRKACVVDFVSFVFNFLIASRRPSVAITATHLARSSRFPNES